MYTIPFIKYIFWDPLLPFPKSSIHVLIWQHTFLINSGHLKYQTLIQKYSYNKIQALYDKKYIESYKNIVAFMSILMLP